MEVYSVAEILRAEAETGELLASGVLMQRAASGLASVVVRELRDRGDGRLHGRRVLLAVGTGNNGGDALWAGVRLLERGVRVSAWQVGSSVHEQGWAAFVRAGGHEVDALGAIESLGETDLVVDGVLGIGGRGGLRGAASIFADACADSATPVIAVDLPSGLEGDSCRAFDSFVADVTVTFGGRKTCHVAQPAASRCGRVDVIDIGLDLAAPRLMGWGASEVAARYPWPGPLSDKYSRGAVGVDTGSHEYPGAAVLSTAGAVYSGAGFVRYVGPAKDAVVAALPNVVPVTGRVQAWLLGCGWGDRPDGAAVLQRRLSEHLPTVVDADAIGLFGQALAGRTAQAAGWSSDVLLTPHAGELASLLGIDRSQVEDDPITHGCAAASSLGVTVLLKGATQYVVEPTGRVTLAVAGPAWTAHAGSGDTLAGMCAAMLAAGRSARIAGLLGASLQAIAARNFPGPRPPQDLVKHLPDVVASLRLD